MVKLERFIKSRFYKINMHNYIRSASRINQEEESLVDRIKNSVKDNYQNFKRLLRTTSIEVLLGAFIGAFSGIYIGDHFQDAKGKTIPLGFSEISQIERDAEKEGKEVEPMARYLTSATDLPMKVFECWNHSHYTALYGSNVHAFARELDMRMDKTFKTHHYEIPDFTKELPRQADKALEGLKPFIVVMNRMHSVNDEFDAAWDDTHIANYIWVPEIYTDSKGNLKTKLVQKYVDTTHIYDYSKKHGEAASGKLDDVIREFPHLEFKEKIRTASKTHAEGEYAAELSRKKELKGKRLSEEELIEIAGTWYTGSTLKQNLGGVYAGWSDLHQDADSWRIEKSTAKDHRYETPFRSDSGPKEFQVAEGALHHGRELVSLIHEPIDAIQFTRVNVPILEHRIRRLIAVELDKKEEGDPEEIMNDIMKLSKDIYTANFKRGFDVEQYSYAMVLVSMLFGAVAGGFLGKCFDVLGERKRWYDDAW